MEIRRASLRQRLPLCCRRGTTRCSRACIHMPQRFYAQVAAERPRMASSSFSAERPTMAGSLCCRAATYGRLQLFGRAATNGRLPLLQSDHVWRAPAFRQSGQQWRAPFAAERPRMAGSSLSAEHPRMTGPRFCRAAECGRLHLCRAAPHFDRRAGRSAWTGQCPSSSWYPCPPCLCLCLYRLLFLFLCFACPCHCHCWSLLHQWHGQSMRLHRQSQSPRRRDSSKS